MTLKSNFYFLFLIGVIKVVEKLLEKLRFAWSESDVTIETESTGKSLPIESVCACIVVRVNNNSANNISPFRLVSIIIRKIWGQS